jgi:hypothetical protein
MKPMIDKTFPFDHAKQAFSHMRAVRISAK